MRKISGVERLDPIEIRVDGQAIQCFPGETVATAIIASGRPRFRDDRSGKARGLLCNMGTCSECMAWVANAEGLMRRTRTCLLPAEPGMIISTVPPQHE